MAVRVAVIGLGAVGGRVARQLAATDTVAQVVVADRSVEAVARVATSLAGRCVPARSPDAAADAVDAVVLATPAGTQHELAELHLRPGRRVVATSDGLDDVRGLLSLDRRARTLGATVAVGAAFAPGLTCLLARSVAPRFDRVTEIHVAKHGTGGPACAIQHHAALGGRVVDWRDGDWVERPAGSGRELVWFPEPVGPVDCYRAELPDPVLLVPAFPGVERVTARLSATRRDRITSRLPMMRPPHPEGTVGAVRVEIRGVIRGTATAMVLGAAERPAVGAAAVAATAALTALPPGAAGLAAVDDPVAVLAELGRRGLRFALFEGGESRTGW